MCIRDRLVTTDEKQTEKSINQVLDGEGVNIDFNATKMLYLSLIHISTIGRAKEWT